MHVENYNNFGDTNSQLPSNLTIDAIVSMLMNFPIALGPSINYTQSSFTEQLIWSCTGLMNFQGFASNAMAADLRGRHRAALSQRSKKTDNPDCKKDMICHGCHHCNHKEVDCHDFSKWIIISGEVECFSLQLKEGVLAN